MIICKKSLNPLEHRINSASFLSYDISIISIFDRKISQDRIYIISLYKPSNINFKIYHWREFFGLIDSISSNCQTFILGDLNSQNKAWGSTICNPSGNSLDRFLLGFSYYFLNNGMSTRISVCRNHKSVSDLSLTNAFNYCGMGF